MENNNTNIDEIIREKFESFSPTPPQHVWAGIEKGIKTKPYMIFFANQRNLAVAAILLLALIASLVYYNPIVSLTSDSDTNHVTIEENIVSNPVNEVIKPVENNNSNDLSNSEIDKRTESNIGLDNNGSNQNEIILDEVSADTKEKLSNEYLVSGHNESNRGDLTVVEASSNESDVTIKTLIESEQNTQLRAKINQLELMSLRKSVFITSETYSNPILPELYRQRNSMPQTSVIDPVINAANSRWKIGYYLSPELSISNFDSVQILNSYTLSVEPSYFINEHWFVRFGVGLSYVRDRGFAKISYLTNDYMGSYDDVYEVTFDTISGNIIPIYHTKTVEIWDTVRHVSVNEVTNKYLYLQVPALIGYYNKKAGSKIGWYVMGGPAVNLKIGSWIDDPKPDEKDADIIDLQNNLPIRSNNYMQLWFGAGVEYEVTKKLSLAFEPGYRYYFKSIYSSPYSPTSSSGFSLRVGLVYNLK